MSAQELLVDQDGAVLTVTFNRPQQRNAMTWDMYEGLYEACEQADADDDVRVMVLRSTSDKAFIAGTDIAQFTDFATGADGVAYEQRITRVVTRLEDVDVPVVAAIQGFCVGEASPSPRSATYGSRHRPRVSASRSPAPWATVSP